MHEYRATTTWRRTSAEFTYETYNRAHEVKFGGGEVVPWSAAPEFKGDAERVNPEEAFVASLSTCHMLTFLAIAARKRFTVDSYVDEAVGRYGTRTRRANTGSAASHCGREWRSRAPVNHQRRRCPSFITSAHENCFVANSVKYGSNGRLRMKRDMGTGIGALTAGRLKCVERGTHVPAHHARNQGFGAAGLSWPTNPRPTATISSGPTPC